jgi:hypothetical protein
LFVATTNNRRCRRGAAGERRVPPVTPRNARTVANDGKVPAADFEEQ